MSFLKKLPDDYYTSKVINKFEEYSFDSFNYDSPFYFRNPKFQYKLSLDHREVIEFFVRLLKPKNFMEMGTQFGETTLKILPLIPGDYYAIDISIDENLKFLKTQYSNLKIFENSTSNFFNNFDGQNFEMVFIDASHDYDTTLNDFLNIKDFIVPDGIIFFHDTYPANIEETDPSLSGDCYRLPEKIRLEYNDEFEIITIPVNPGLSMARKIKKNIGNE